MKLGQHIKRALSNKFRKRFAWGGIGGLAPKSRPVLIYQPTAINRLPVMMSF